MDFEKGKSYKILVMEVGEIRKAHIVELIENDMIVYKWFGKRKQWWHYFVKTRTEFEFYMEMAEKFKKESKPSHIPSRQ